MIMQAIINGIPTNPILRISKRPSLIPRQTIPSLKINLREKFMPSENIFGIVKIFPIIKPIIIESIIGEIGLFFKFNISIPIKLLKYMPERAIIKLTKIPGKTLYMFKIILISSL